METDKGYMLQGLQNLQAGGEVQVAKGLLYILHGIEHTVEPTRRWEGTYYRIYM